MIFYFKLNLISIFLFIINYNKLSVLADPLEDYVKQPDPYYHYELLKEYNFNDHDLFIINMTSQKWQDETFSSRPIWWHYLCIAVPKKLIRSDSAFMLIDGGDNTDPEPTPSNKYVSFITLFAVTTGSIAANLMQVPNQPILYNNDPLKKERREDASIAWTWKKFMENTSDPTLILRLPMTKAAYKGMDTITDFANRQGFGQIKKFMISGYSKRGWTTWLTAAVDNERVFAAAPIVMDLLNINYNLHNHYKSLGGWTFAFNDYYDLNITMHSDTIELYALTQIEDPINYLNKYFNKNFLVITMSGDEFFIADDTYSWWYSLRQVTNNRAYFRRFANGEHFCVGHELNIFLEMSSFYINLYENVTMPKLDWTMPNNMTHGIIKAQLEINDFELVDAKVYYANTIDFKRRDFRLAVADPNNPRKPFPNPVLWKSTTTKLRTTQIDENNLIFEASFPMPYQSWLGFFIEFTLVSPYQTSSTFTTETNVIPNVYPFEDCFREQCYGNLV